MNGLLSNAWIWFALCTMAVFFSRGIGLQHSIMEVIAGGDDETEIGKRLLSQIKAISRLLSWVAFACMVCCAIFANLVVALIACLFSYLVATWMTCRIFRINRWTEILLPTISYPLIKWMPILIAGVGICEIASFIGIRERHIDKLLVPILIVWVTAELFIRVIAPQADKWQMNILTRSVRNGKR